MDDTRQQERIQVELVRQALTLAPIGVFATLLNAFLLVLVLWSAISHTSLIIWFSVTFCFVLQRSLFLYKYRRVSLQPREAAQVAKRYMVSLGLAGIGWGSVGIFLFPVDSPTHQTLIVFVLCGMVAGAAETFAPLLPVFISFALPTLVPLFIRFLTIGGAVYYSMSAMTLLYLVLTIIIARRVNLTNRTLIELKEHSSRMAEERTAANAQLQERTAELSVSNKALMEYATKLERLNKDLEDFAFVASHDLQEPLRKIQTFCDMTQKRGTLDTVGQEYLQRVMSLASHMRQLLSDLLQFSLVSSKPEPLKAIDLVSIAREAADAFEEKIKETDGLIEIETMPTLEADETQILHLFQNLIGNALKFRSAEPPRVVIYAKHKGQGICEIFVKDNGVGFDPEFVERIFRPFQRLHKGIKYEGTGIGLSICRKIAERHGGSIRAESEPGKGSTFIVRLPVKQESWERLK